MDNLKTYLKEPVHEIFEAARLLSDAVNFHLLGDNEQARALFIKANQPRISEWTESLWGSEGVYSELVKTHGIPGVIPTELRDKKRMPSKREERFLLKRDGYYCRFCGIPVIRKETRDFIKQLYPDAIPWGKTNKEQHAAFQAMWVQFDHLVPHARGGKTELDNLVITCSPCNYSRMNFLLDEINLQLLPIKIKNASDWDGLERIFARNH